MKPEELELPDAEAIARAVRAAVSEEMALVVQEAKANCPADTGALRESIGYRVNGLSGEVYAAQPYGVHVEMGTAYMPARPFMYPALRAHQQAIARRAAQAAARCMREGRNDDSQ